MLSRVEKIKYNPYNLTNVVVTQEDIEKILTSQEVFHPIGNLSLYQQAKTTPRIVRATGVGIQITRIIRCVIELYN